MNTKFQFNFSGCFTFKLFLYVLYCTYGNSKLIAGLVNHPILLSSIITENDLGTININGFPVPTENHIKNKLKTKYHDLNIDDINVTNITQWNAIINLSF